MDRRQHGTAAAHSFTACPAPVQGGSAAPHQGHAVEGRATRRGAAVRRPPLALSRSRTATNAATRDTGSARRRPSHDRSCPLPARAVASPGTQPSTEILSR